MVRGFMVHSFEFGHPLFVLWHSTACLLGTTFILCVCIVVRSCETVVQTWDNRVLHLHLQHLERGRRWWLDLVPWSPGHFCRTLKQDLWEETGQTSLSWPLSSRTLGSKEQWQQRWAFQLWVHKTLCGGDVREEGREGGKWGEKGSRGGHTDCGILDRWWSSLGASLSCVVSGMLSERMGSVDQSVGRCTCSCRPH